MSHLTPIDFTGNQTNTVKRNAMIGVKNLTLRRVMGVTQDWMPMSITNGLTIVHRVKHWISPPLPVIHVETQAQAQNSYNNHEVNKRKDN